MKEQKEALRERFSANYRKYYMVDLFRREGFVRKKCESCGKFFWTLDGDRRRCDDQPCSPYTFIGRPPTKKRLSRVECWKAIESFFVKNGHTSVKRYPVVSRWRPDLYFTVASIIDFQRIESGRVVFQLPANPLVVPQMCLRFNDIPSVGVSGKHFTSFVMVGQHSVANKEGYWKDRCIDLDFELITKQFGISPNEVTFNEDVWVGYGAFGYSLEYFVRGLELGNAVFTAYEGDMSRYKEMKEKVVDMGAGLERFTWITRGTPTAYDSNFSYVLSKMNEMTGITLESELFTNYFRLAGRMNVDEFGSLSKQRGIIAKELGLDDRTLERQIAPLEASYAVADHAQTLLFGIADGMLPSNSGGGYNLRIIFRRAMSLIRRHGLKLSLMDVVNWHIDDLSAMYPELAEHREDVARVLDVETSRYVSSSERVTKIVASISSSGKQLSTEDLIRLYDSDGVTPEQLVDAGVNVLLPEDFYEKVQSRHVTKKMEVEKPKFDTTGLPATKLLYYNEDEAFDFSARVLAVLGGSYVVLDRTMFYPRGGGQEPDRGTIGSARVVDVEKYGDIVLHRIEGKAPEKGARVLCSVDFGRRSRITRIHTATHILNGSSRQVLGPWVWQHSAFKEENYGRLDITHFSHLSQAEVQKIEDTANEVVRRNLPVKAFFMQRKDAEEKYGFRLYQGGVVPARMLRIVNIGDWDIEACGGTHNRSTGEVGFIKITRVERVQDGVERIEFVAGEPAVNYIHTMESTLDELSSLLNVQRDNLTKAVRSLTSELEEARSRAEALGAKLVELSVPQVVLQARRVGSVKLYVEKQTELGEAQIIAQGSKCVSAEPSLVYVSLFSTPNSARVICFVGDAARQAGLSADEIAKTAAKALGGSAGGSATFAQGGGPNSNQVSEAVAAVEKLVEAKSRTN